MRFYAMGNYYLSSIQQGIQAAHALGEMFNNYLYDAPGPGKMLRDWNHAHKTMVLLNGGNAANLRELWTLLTDERNTEFPVSKFCEDEPSLNGALTCVAIVLPERLYDAYKVYPDAEFPAWDEDIPPQYRTPRWFYGEERIVGWEEELLNAIKSLGLAR